MTIKSEIRLDKYDFKATRTDSGFVLDQPVITRSGVFPYARADGSVSYEYRPDDVVFDPEVMANLKGIPITKGHHNGLNSKNIASVLAGTVISSGIRDGDTMRADVAIHNSEALDQGWRELSLQYGVLVEDEPGEFNGQKYDTVLKKITKWDHLAIVPKGRAGPSARIRMDSAELLSDEDLALDNQQSTVDDVTMTTKAIRLDSGIEYQVPPEVSVEVDRIKKEAQTRADALNQEKSRADAAEAKADALKAQIEQVRADAAIAVRERIKLEGKAEKMGVAIRSDMSDRAVHEAILAKLSGGKFSAEGRSDEYVAASLQAYEDIQASIKPVASVTSIKQRADAADSTGKDPDAFRAEMIARNHAQFKKG